MPQKWRNMFSNKNLKLKWCYFCLLTKLPFDLKKLNLFKNTLKKYVKLYIKFEKKNMDINFLLICKNENMVPKFIHNVKVHSLFLDEDSSKFKKKLLRRSIENERRTRKIIYEELYRVRLLLINIVGIDYFRFCVSYVLKCFKSDYLQKLHSHTCKLNDLRKFLV